MVIGKVYQFQRSRTIGLVLVHRPGRWSTSISRQWVYVSCLRIMAHADCIRDPSKHQTLNQCCFNVTPMSYQELSDYIYASTLKTPGLKNF